MSIHPDNQLGLNQALNPAHELGFKKQPNRYEVINQIKCIMKTKNLCLLLGILLAFLSCTKDNDIPKHRLSDRDIQVTK